MLKWLRDAWDQASLAYRAFEELQEDNTLSRLAGGEIRVSEARINELLAETKMEGVRNVSMTAGEGTFTVSARSERLFLARVALPLRIESVIFTRYRHRLKLVPAGPVSAFGANLWQKATAYTVVLLIRHILGADRALVEASDPAAGITFDGRALEIDLHKMPDFRAALDLEYRVGDRQIHPLHFVVIDSIVSKPGYFEVRSSVNWEELNRALRDIAGVQ
jgi:hypothetical protein